MLRSVLVAVGDQPEDYAAMQYAYVLAGACSASLFGHLVIDASEIGQKGLSLLRQGEFHLDTRQMLQDRGRELLDEFAAQCCRRDLRYRSEVVIGDYRREIFQRMLEVDLAVLGINERESSLSPVVDLAVRTSLKPVLLVRDKYAEIRRILVSFDGSAQSGHCLQLGAHLAELLEAHVVLFTATTDQLKGHNVLAGGVAYLEHYQVKYTPILKGGDVVEEMTRYVHEVPCDLVIVGASGHTRLQELLFSSTSQRIAQRVGTPVLLYH